MVSQIIKNTFENVYKDDFKDSDNYHRVLFNPARPVQARELTQMQTIIQKELERFGRNIFKEGAAVNPVNNIYVNNRYSFVKLSGITTLSSSLVGQTFTGSTSGVSGKVVEVVSATGSDPATLYVAYNSGNSNTNVKFSAGETITDGSTTLTVQSTNTTANPATGYGTRVDAGEGQFFVLGHFVFVESSNIILSKYSSTPTAEVGFRISESIITASDESALYDNQGETPNTTAPGADRYRIRLELISKDDLDSADTFVYVAKIKDGVVLVTNDGRTEYNKILDVMAQRTFEESGNYTVKAPFAEFSSYADSPDNLSLRVSGSISYVNGYRVETLPGTIDVQKPITTETVNNEAVSINYGNYIEVNDLKGLPNISQFEQVNLIDDSDYGSGSSIGTARVRAIETSGANYLFHLFDIRMTGANNFRSTRSIGTSATENAKVVTERGNAVLKEVTLNDLLFPLPNIRPSSLSDVVLTVQRVFTATTDGSGSVTLNLTTPDEDFSSTSDWLVAVDSSGDLITPSITTPTTTSATISGAPFNSALTVFGFVRKGGSSGSFRTKTLTTSTVTAALDSDGNGLRYLDLGEVDIYELDSARDGSSSGIDIASKFRLDNGQRDNFYDHGRLILNTGETAPTGNVYAKFKHFAHGGTGNFFCVNSYSGQVDYENIPTYRQKNGERVFLSDVLDFRSTINDAGNGFTGTGGLVNELPQNTELLTSDVSYFLPRMDKLVVNSANGLQYIKGEPGFNPKPPQTPSNSMLVYNFQLNAKTLNEKDLKSEFINNRRYTMKDIAELDQKIENVREMASLSLLDVQASTIEVLDDQGLPRTKSGFLTDDFRDHSPADINNEEHRAAIDLNAGILTSSYRRKNVGLLFDSATSTNIVMKGNLVLLDYTEEEYLSQPEASRPQNVNPFTRIDFEGVIELSPETDEWVEEVATQEIVETVTTEPAGERDDDDGESRFVFGNERPPGAGWRLRETTAGGNTIWER